MAPAARRARRLAALSLAAIGAALCAVLLLAWLNPTPVRVEASAADFAPLAKPLTLIGDRRVLGSPAVSSESAPPIERHYLLLRAEGHDVDSTASLVASHLESRGWQMETEQRQDEWWFTFSSTRSPTGEQAYVGALSAYLSAGSWAADDGDAPAELRRLAGRHRADAVVVQIFGAST